MVKTKSRVYFRLLALCWALDQEQQFGLDATSVQLLREIGIAVFNEKPKSVTELMALSHVASAATIHRKLQQLIEAGLVEVGFVQPDRRTKRLHLASAGKKYFSSRDKLIAVAMNEGT